MLPDEFTSDSDRGGILELSGWKVVGVWCKIRDVI